jgi:hypothetical protein
MTDPGFNETLYFKDGDVKVTDLRITAAHVTVPLDRIEQAVVNLKTAEMSSSFIIFLLSLTAIPVGLCYYGHCCWFGVLLSAIALVYLISIYRTYTDLKITAGSRSFKLLDASMRNREYIYQIAEALEEALSARLQQENIS